LREKILYFCETKCKQILVIGEDTYALVDAFTVFPLIG